MEKRIPQPSRRDKPDGTRLGKDDDRVVHRSETTAQRIDVLPNLDHARDPPVHHGFDGRQIDSKRVFMAGVAFHSGI